MTRRWRQRQRGRESNRDLVFRARLAYSVQYATQHFDRSKNHESRMEAASSSSCDSEQQLTFRREPREPDLDSLSGCCKTCMAAEVVQRSRFDWQSGILPSRLELQNRAHTKPKREAASVFGRTQQPNHKCRPRPTVNTLVRLPLRLLGGCLSVAPHIA